MSISRDDVRYLARLSRLKFSEEEEERLAGELGNILDYMDLLSEVDTEDVEPMTHVLDLVNVVRPDEVQQRITREEALRNAPSADSDYVRVPKVIE